MDDLVFARNRAEELWRQAYSQQRQGQLAEAIALYQASLETYPTAEAHTFLGWTYSFLGRYEDAIAECRKAIEVDPDFGNPYNDIGVYLLDTGRPREALPWLLKATQAARYEVPHYPWLNLGRVYEQIGPLLEALECYRYALELEPNYPAAKEALRDLLARLN
jgi:tetratricopeptide (TPR) repeat protein